MCRPSASVRSRAIFGTSLAFWLWFPALKKVELNQANAFTFLVPIFGLVVGAGFFDEQLGWSQAAGAALVVTGVVFVQLDVSGESSGP